MGCCYWQRYSCFSCLFKHTYRVSKALAIAFVQILGKRNIFDGSLRDPRVFQVFNHPRVASCVTWLMHMPKAT